MALKATESICNDRAKNKIKLFFSFFFLDITSVMGKPNKK
jgi:hypothetical protein